jgi:GTP-binding protein
MKTQAEIAIETANVIVFMCDIHAGLTADDRDIGVMLLKSGKPVIVCVNKIDSVGALPLEYYEFYELGFDGDPIALSSVHGTGTGDLLDRILELSDAQEEEEDHTDSVKVAVIGKPNAGKSSLVNRVLGEERMIVSNIAGTTRDAIDSFVENEHGKFTFIDTAGIRRQSKILDRIEKYSVLRAHAAVERADVCLLLIDATEGITDQDEKIAGIAHEAGKATIIVVNKWDLVEKNNNSVKEFTDKIRTSLAYMPYAPILFISAKTGQRLPKLFEFINYVNEQAALRISTGMLNDVLSEAITRVPPPTDRGRRLKIYYMTQVDVRPPTFVIFCNEAELFHFSYQRYLENKIREVFGFNGTPIRFVIRQKGDE